jgi:hypothetical protein
MSSRFSRRGTPEPKTCRYCKDEGHIISKCPKLFCTHCRTYGHKTYACPCQTKSTRPVSVTRAEPATASKAVVASKLTNQKVPTNLFDLLDSSDDEQPVTKTVVVDAYSQNFPTLPAAKKVEVAEKAPFIAVEPSTTTNAVVFSKPLLKASNMNWAEEESDSDSDSD